jgi:2-iminobutanoate/2-iminopropanoate deaminase
MRQAVSTDSAPAALGPYSQAIIAGGFVFCSGTAGIDPATGAVAEGIEAHYMPDPPPARSAPANVNLPRGLLISIDAIAVLPAA